MYKGTECTQPIFVVRNVKQNLLGFPAIRALQEFKYVNAVTQSILEQFPTLFTGLGTLKGEPYEICLKLEAQPFALYPKECAIASSTESERGTLAHAVIWSHLPSPRANSLVC